MAKIKIVVSVINPIPPVPPGPDPTTMGDDLFFTEDVVLKQYKGKRIVVTGEELLDERWQNTPVLIVDALQTVE